MAFKHGKDTYISLAGNNLSPYTDSSELNRTADSHDTTTYGQTAHRKSGGLLDGKATMSGTYDNTAAIGPRAVIRPLLGTNVELIRRVEGAGSGRPQDRVQVLVTSYVETNPVADMVKWSCEMELDGAVDASPQP